MSQEYKEWNDPEIPQKSAELIEQSEQKLMNELETLFQEPDEEKLSETKDTFREFPSVTLMDGLTLERLQRERFEAEELADIDPEDYTSASDISDTGALLPGQIELDKLSDRAMENISGDVRNDIPLWHYQLEPSSCAVACQDFALRGTGNDTVSEQQLIDEGRQLGIYRDQGTYYHEIGLLAERHGMEREMLQNAALEQIEQIHDAGGKVIALVSCMKMAYPNAFGFWRSDHAVEVIGIDRNDPQDVRVILNDPGREDGQGLSVPAKVFEKAWKTSKNSLVALYPKEAT